MMDGGGEGPEHRKRPRGEWSLPHRTGLGIRGMRRYRWTPPAEFLFRANYSHLLLAEITLAAPVS